MYKVYRDPEGKTVQINVTSTDHQRQPQPQPRASFQYSEDVYRLQIQKLNGEISTLRQRVINTHNSHSQCLCCVCMYLCVILAICSCIHAPLANACVLIETHQD